jgi:hypothetical protein
MFSVYKAEQLACSFASLSLLCFLNSNPRTLSASFDGSYYGLIPELPGDSHSYTASSMVRVCVVFKR